MINMLCIIFYVYEYIITMTLLRLENLKSILDMPNPTTTAPYGNNISVPLPIAGAI